MFTPVKDWLPSSQDLYASVVSKSGTGKDIQTNKAYADPTARAIPLPHVRLRSPWGAYSDDTLRKLLKLPNPYLTTPEWLPANRPPGAATDDLPWYWDERGAKAEVDDKWDARQAKFADTPKQNPDSEVRFTTWLIAAGPGGYDPKFIAGIQWTLFTDESREARVSFDGWTTTLPPLAVYEQTLDGMDTKGGNLRPTLVPIQLKK
jgi:hypothetical protein